MLGEALEHGETEIACMACKTLIAILIDDDTRDRTGLTFHRVQVFQDDGLLERIEKCALLFELNGP